MGWIVRFGCLIAGLTASMAATTWAHGTGARVVGNDATVVELYYTDGEPMAYAEAKVFSPEAPDVPFVNGRADKLGRVSFAADRDGAWRIEAHDNEGHSLRTDVTIAAGAAIPRRALGGNPWLLWVSLFINVFVVASLADAWRRRRLSTVSRRNVVEGTSA